MTTSTIAIEPGLKGTLSPQEYTTKVEPHWGETYPMIAGYGNIDYVCVAFATDADKAAALIPKELDLIKIPGCPVSRRRTWYSPSTVSAISDRTWK